ncbi:elongation of fatty acids protein a-like [Trifolium pratense]|uniref:Elongation of fatty acids protein a-like n=1 Tax=Trifolium pratense TaxID=57577 RepID=A0A2K3NGN0_TRIPR|nr:elongation of fatty acids protein a-like [Trifolium pratense]
MAKPPPPATVIRTIFYYLSEHPSIISFRWSHTHSWGSTWSFLFTSIATYLILSLFLHLSLSLLFPNRRQIPLGPIPAIHSLIMSLISVTIFTGTLISAISEIHDTRWFWRNSKTPFQWLLCFPLGTRPSGRVFFCGGGGCNGIGAWVFNSILNTAVLVIFLNFYVKMYYVDVWRTERRRKVVEESESMDCSSSCPMLIAGSR